MQPLLLRLLAITLAASPLSAQTDTTAPSVPVNLAGTAASSTTIVLYWTQANDDVGVSAYEIERDGTHLVTHADNTLLDTGLIPGTTHTYKVAARDAAGNLSAYSNPSSSAPTAPKTRVSSAPGI
jgi:chitinase